MSFQVCCVTGCLHKGNGMHRFPDPIKHPERFKIWKLFSGVDREGLTETAIVASRRICRSHFSEQYHYPRNKLSRLAIPTLLPAKDLKARYSGISEPVKDGVKACDIAPNSQSLDFPASTKSSNASPIHEIAANKPTESLSEQNCDKEAKIPRPMLIEDVPVDDSVDAAEHGPLITEDQGDIMYHDHDDDPLRPVAEARNDSNLPVDKSLDPVEHGPPITEDHGDISMYHDGDPLRPVAEARNDSNDPVDKSGDAVEHEPPITEDHGDISMYHDDDPLELLAEDRIDSNDEEAGRPPDGTDECYFCNVCKESIKGFRYTCIQCEDWDLCGACEARAAHAAHYVLRIPSPRPYKEIQAVLTAVRRQLINKKIIPGKAESVNEDPYSEPEDSTELDPLDWDDDFYEKDSLGIDLEDAVHPPCKRLRPDPSSTLSDQDLTTPETLKPTRDHTTDVLFNHDITKSSKHKPKTLPNDNPSIPNPGLMGQTGTTPQTTGTLPTLNSKRRLTLKPISKLPLGARVIKLCFGNSANRKKICNVRPKPRKVLHPGNPGPSNTRSDQNLTPKTTKPTHDRTTDAHFNHDVTNSAKYIQPGTLPNDSPTISKPGLNRLIGTMPQTTGTVPTRALNSRTTFPLNPNTGLPLDLGVVKKTVIVGNLASRLSEEKTGMSSPTVDKSSSQRPYHASTVSPPTATLTTLERAAMSDPKWTPLGLSVFKKPVSVENSASRLSEEKTGMSSPTVDKSSFQRPYHITTVSPPTATITTLERAALSDAKWTPLGLGVFKKPVSVESSASRLSEEKTGMSSPTVDKSSFQRPYHITTVSPPTATITTIERAALSDAKWTPLGLGVFKKPVSVENSASRLSEEKTAISFPCVDKSSFQRPYHATTVSPPNAKITTLERAAMSNPKWTPLELGVFKKPVSFENSASRLSEEKTEMSSPTVDKSSFQRPYHATTVSPPTATITTIERAALSDAKWTPLGLGVFKKPVSVVNSTSRLSEEQTAMSFPCVDKSSFQRPYHATNVSPSNAKITTLERAAMSDPKASSKSCLRILKGSSPANVVIAPKCKVFVRLKPIDDRNIL